MVHELKVCFFKIAPVIKVIADGNDTKRPSQSTSEVFEPEESQLVQKNLTFMIFIMFYFHQTFELQSAHVTFFKILLYHAKVFSYVLAVLLFYCYILNHR